MRFPFFRRLFPVALVLFTAAAYGDDIGTGLAVDPSAREQARVLYNTVYQASEGVPSGWTGNVSTGVAGTTSSAFKTAINLRVNYFRAMGGVPTVVKFSDALSVEDQQAALMMSANHALDHFPPPTWIDYTAAGADAASHSNLTSGSLDDGPAAITSYIFDNGGNNTATGHRRWVLYPPETLMGTGDVDGSSDGTFLSANCLHILDTATFASPAPASRDGFVAWPPPGFVPYSLVSPRWSLAVPGADFSAATVTMTRNGQALPVRLEALEAGYGDTTLVWVPDNLDPTNPPVPTAPSPEVSTSVTVANVLVNGAAKSFTYNVTPFDPVAAGADTVTPALAGPAAPAVGGANVYTFNAVPNATGYQWQASAVSPLTLDLDAESGPGDVTILPAGTNLITTTQAAHGSASYQFASSPAETLTVNTAFLPTAGSALTFNSRLDFASTSETARVQISTDGGNTWADVYSITGLGTGGATEAAFGAHAIDLSPYAGQSCTVRFAYAFSGSGVFFPRAAQTGWFVDDIVVTGAQTVSAPATAAVPAGQTAVTFVPGTAGGYALQVTPIFYGQYAADTGPVLMVTAQGSGPAITVSSSAGPVASASGGVVGVFTLTRASADLSQKIVVHYKLKGPAVNGTDYAELSGKAKIKPNHATAAVQVVAQGDLGGEGSKKVKFVLLPGNGYSVGVPATAKVKIVP